jgi:hypothetical protein
MLHPEAQRLADYLFSLAPTGTMTGTFVESAIADFAENHPHDPADDILPGWNVADINSLIEERFDGQLSREDAIAVLEHAQNNFDANRGVNWDYLDDCIRILVGFGAIALIEGEG